MPVCGSTSPSFVVVLPVQKVNFMAAVIGLALRLQ
jgi:hypothetical protein